MLSITIFFISKNSSMVSPFLKEFIQPFTNSLKLFSDIKACLMTANGIDTLYLSCRLTLIYSTLTSGFTVVRILSSVLEYSMAFAGLNIILSIVSPKPLTFPRLSTERGFLKSPLITSDIINLLYNTFKNVLRANGSSMMGAPISVIDPLYKSTPAFATTSFNVELSFTTDLTKSVSFAILPLLSNLIK